LEADLIKVGQVLYPKRGKYAGRNGLIVESGEILVEGKLFDTPSGAAFHLKKSAVAGWHFWLVSQEPRQMLWDIRQQFIEGLNPDTELDDDEDDDEGDDD